MGLQGSGLQRAADFAQTHSLVSPEGLQEHQMTPGDCSKEGH